MGGICIIRSHDLQEPLRTVTGFVELLRMILASNYEDAKEYVRFISAQTKRMSELIKACWTFRGLVRKRSLNG